MVSTMLYIFFLFLKSRHAEFSFVFRVGTGDIETWRRRSRKSRSCRRTRLTRTSETWQSERQPTWWGSFITRRAVGGRRGNDGHLLSIGERTQFFEGTTRNDRSRCCIRTGRSDGLVFRIRFGTISSADPFPDVRLVRFLFAAALLHLFPQTGDFAGHHFLGWSPFLRRSRRLFFYSAPRGRNRIRIRSNAGAAD